MRSSVVSGVGDPVFENDTETWIKILRSCLLFDLLKMTQICEFNIKKNSIQNWSRVSRSDIDLMFKSDTQVGCPYSRVNI